MANTKGGDKGAKGSGNFKDDPARAAEAGRKGGKSSAGSSKSGSGKSGSGASK